MKLFNINQYKIDTSKFSGLHDEVVQEFEHEVASFVGAKYACGVNSATNAIFLSLLDKKQTVKIPSMIPPVVCNAILTSGNQLSFEDNVDWVGDSYILHKFGDYKIIDSAQKLEKDQYINEANPEDLMIFSFYPTKPVGSFDGGMIVSNDKTKIDQFRIMTMNGSTFDKKSWKRKFEKVGYKCYLNAIQAYIGLQNLSILEEKYEKLDAIREHYNAYFGLNNTSNHLYRISVDNRKQLLEASKEHGIELGIHYEAAHLNPLYKCDSMDLPNTITSHNKTVSIPFNEKMSLNQASKVISFIHKNAALSKTHK